MPGIGPPPNPIRRRRNVPARGNPAPAPGAGWQHGDIPAPPPRLLAVSRLTWDTWFRSWWAANWTPAHLPQIRTTIKLFDAFERGDLKAVTELRQWMDGIGVTPKGQQALRWLPPKEDESTPPGETPDPYAHLRAV